MAAPSRPAAQIRDFQGAALEQLGSDATGVALEMMDRQKKRTNFEADHALNKFLTQADIELQDRADNIAEGGRGFAKSYLTEYYKPGLSKFESTLPADLDPDVKAQLMAKAELYSMEVSHKAASVENAEVQRFQGAAISDVVRNYAFELEANGSDNLFDEATAAIKELTDNSNLTNAQKRAAMDEWQKLGGAGYAEYLLSANPYELFKKFGGRAIDLGPSALAGIMRGSMLSVAPNGVKGEDRVTPFGMRLEDVVRLAGKVDPGNGMEEDAGAERWSSYLKNEGIRNAYVDALLREKQTAFKGDHKRMGVAFYMGDDFAKAWDGKLTSLPKNVARSVGAVVDDLSYNVSGPGTVNVTFKGAPLDPTALGNVTPKLLETAQSVFAGLGFDNMNINSAERSWGTNKGASKSMHEMVDADGHSTGRSGALDIAWPAGATVEDKIRIIEAFSAMGVQGIGVYGSNIHIDFGARRSWGPKDSSGKYGDANLPSWAKPILDAHDRDEYQGGGNPIVDERFRGMSDAQRRAYKNQAGAALDSAYKATVPDLPTVRAEADRLLTDHIADIKAGNADPSFNESLYLSQLTPSRRNEVADDIEVAGITYDVTKDAATKSESDLEAMLNSVLPEPGTTVSGVQERVVKEVEARVEEIRGERTKNPAAAAMNFPSVQEAAKLLSSSRQITPEAMQNYIKAITDVQRGKFGMDGKDQMYVWREHALDLAGYMSAITRDERIDAAEQKRLFATFYNSAKSMYGDYTDEVMRQVLWEMRGNVYGGKPGDEHEAMFVDAMTFVASGRKPPSWLTKAADASARIEDWLAKNPIKDGRIVLPDGSDSAPQPGGGAAVESTATIIDRYVGVGANMNDAELAELLSGASPEVQRAVRSKLGR